MVTTPRLVELARKWIPRPVRSFVQRHVSLAEFKDRWRAEAEPLSALESYVSDRWPDGPVVAIVRNRSQYHTQFVRACLELDTTFEVIDLLAPDWFSRVSEAKPDLVLFWPEAISARRMNALKDRMTIVESVLGIPVMPAAADAWAYEDKMRMWYWLESHGFSHPRTSVYFQRSDALRFAETCTLPIVKKANFGASATGVTIHRDRPSLLRSIRKSFGRGDTIDGYDHRDRERGFVILQDYVPIQAEWRMVRIGESFFGHAKGKAGDFHSGSGEVDWSRPPDALLDLLEAITERGGFRSMNVDVFETTSGDFLVNELQAVFGASFSKDQTRVDGRPGRFIRSSSGTWQFEAGDFARNMCANLRLADAMTQLGHPIDAHWDRAGT